MTAAVPVTNVDCRFGPLCRETAVRPLEAHVPRSPRAGGACTIGVRAVLVGELIAT